MDHKEAFESAGFADFNKLAETMSVDEMAEYIERICKEIHPASSHGARRLFSELIRLAKYGKLVKNIAPGRGIMRDLDAEGWNELNYTKHEIEITGSSFELDCALNYVQPEGQNKYLKGKPNDLQN